MASEFRREPVLKLLLNRENPRHTPKENQAEIIEHLLAGEEVYNLAKHLSKKGFNPLEVAAVFRDDDGNLVAAEGNRRICAAQLLTDPNKAPPSARTKFKALADAAKEDVSRIMVREFPNYEAARPWLQILHDGEQDGVGRRQWSPTQKARATMRKSTDALALALLDHSTKLGWIDPDERTELQLSTVTRYLANPEVRAALGIASAATSSELLLHADDARFETATKRFLSDIKSGKLSSRSRGEDWRAYAKEVENDLGEVPILSTPRRALIGSGTSPKAKAKPEVDRPAKARLAVPDTTRIAVSKRLADALNDLGSHKLSSLYKSMTTLRLDEHPALLTTGAWVFLEALTAQHGRADGTKFTAYLNGKVSGAFDRMAWKAKRISLEYIENHGNVEKHHPSFSSVDARNLYIHFQTLDDLLVKLVSECPR